MKLSVIKYLSQKIRFSATRVHTDEEIWHINSSRINVIIGIILFLLVIAGLVIFLTLRSPLANYIPGFHGKKSQEKLVESLYKLDSLTNEVNRWEKYNENLTLVLDGGNSVSEAVDSITKTDRKIAPRIVLDSIFREKVKQDSLLHHTGRKNQIKNVFELLPPSSGMISSRFNPAIGNNGIVITPPPSGSILAVMDGTIVNSTWNPTNGWTIIIQHSGGLISVYKYLASSLLSSGQRIGAGEVIGMASSLESGTTPKLEFEIWHNGNVVDPENYIRF